MKDRFTYCPKCSTRNFADDEVCRVCKTTPSSQTPNQAIKKTMTGKSTDWKALLTIIGVVIIFYLVFIRNNGTSNNNHSSSSSKIENYNESNQVSKYYVNEESFATMSEEEFDEMYGYVVDNDMQALRTMLGNGRIVIFPKGTPISIAEVPSVIIL